LEGNKLPGTLPFLALPSSATFASGGQNPFYKKGSGLPKIFHWDGLDTLFSFVSFCVTSWLKTGGGFWRYWAVGNIHKNRSAQVKKIILLFFIENPN
jgi:hypothetical protein